MVGAVVGVGGAVAVVVGGVAGVVFLVEVVAKGVFVVVVGVVVAVEVEFEVVVRGHPMKLTQRVKKKYYFVHGSWLDALLLQKNEEQKFNKNPKQYLENKKIITEFEFTNEERIAFMLGVKNSLRYDDDMFLSELYKSKDKAIEAIIEVSKNQ